MLRRLVLVFLPLFAFAPKVLPQNYESIGVLGFVRDVFSWPEPEFLVRDLRSTDPSIRLKAFQEFGLDDTQSHKFLFWPNGSQKERVVNTPDQISFHYAALGDSDSKDAVIALAIDDLQLNFVAVAMPTNSGWKRIATFSCGCKYDPGLNSFVELRPATPSGSRFELILRASSGGSGIYVRDEYHFRLFQNEMQLGISFTSQTQSCPQTEQTPFCHWSGDSS